MKILVDMDGVIVNLDKKWYGAANRDHGSNITEEDITAWDIAQFFPCGKKIYDYLHIPGFFRDLEPLPGAIEGMRKLHEAGHELYILSAAVPMAATDKILWVQEHLPFIPVKNVILTPSKGMVKGDVLIDDGPHNLKDYREAWPDSIIVAFDYPYTRSQEHLADLVLRDGYKDPAKAWEQIVDRFVCGCGKQSEVLDMFDMAWCWNCYDGTEACGYCGDPSGCCDGTDHYVNGLPPKKS